MYICFLSRITDKTLTKLGFWWGVPIAHLFSFLLFVCLWPVYCMSDSDYPFGIFNFFLPASMDCPLCCFLRFVLLTTPASEWLLLIAKSAILTYIIVKTSYIRSDGIDVHFLYYISTWLAESLKMLAHLKQQSVGRHVALLRHIISIPSQRIIAFWIRNTQ